MAKPLILGGAASTVCYWHLADIELLPGDVRFWG